AGARPGGAGAGARPATRPSGGGANKVGNRSVSPGGSRNAFGGGSANYARASSARGGRSMGGGGMSRGGGGGGGGRRRGGRRRARRRQKVSKPTKQSELIKPSSKTMNSMKISLVTCVVLAGLTCVGLQAAEPKQSAASAASSQQKQFNTPKEAADSLVQAAGSFDVAALKEILGPDCEDVVASEDPVMDKNRAVAFAEKAKEKTAVGTDPKNPNQAVVTVGKDDFPLPIPLVKNKGKWMFDMKTGREEILNRRVGANELDAISICHGFVEAQQEYALEKHDDSKVNQYAQRIISTPGKHDGLAWQNPDGTWAGPVGETIAKAVEQGYTRKDQPQPFHGYYFKVLKGQGPDAPMGQMDFV